MTKPKKKFPQFFIGFLVGAVYFFAVTILSMVNNTVEHVDNNVPSWVDCTDGKDVLIEGHSEPTFFCTHYERNNVPLQSSL